MNTALGAPPILNPAPPSSAFSDSFRAAIRRVRGWLIVAWKFLAGMLCCQSLLGAILLVGWTCRLMQRTAFKRWWDRSQHRAQGIAFRDFLAADSATRPLMDWPNWIIEPSSTRQRIRLRSLLHSFWRNLRIGAQVIVNTWVLTLPGCLLMLFSWYDGWNNSFNKGYEQAAVGPAVGLLGLNLFIVSMFYIPLAQARHAVTGEWRAFYDFRLLRKLILRRWPACLGLAILYSAISWPIMMLRMAPQFFPQMTQQSAEYIATLSHAELLKTLNNYYFACALAVFPAYVFLRIIASRIYATGLLSAVESGAIAMEQLAPAERAVLERLNLLHATPSPRRHLLIRLAGKGVSIAFWTFAAITMYAIWFSFGAQIYIAQFMNYIPAWGWLNHPLVQLPLFHFIPAALK